MWNLGGIYIIKLLFNKIGFNGQWFYNNEYPKGFMEKVPPDTGYVFNDELDMWELPPLEEETIES